MIEVFITPRKDENPQGLEWELKATVFPHGGISALPQEATIAQLSAPSFGIAFHELSDETFSNISFSPNTDRWPVSGPKFQIINDYSHPDREKFGNYRIEQNGLIIGHLQNIPRHSRGALIRAAIKVVLNPEKAP